MPNFNKVFLIGNLTHDPDLKKTASDGAVARFGLATNRTFHKADGTECEQVCFVEIVVWDALAEVCAQYLKKGKLVFIEGRLELKKWEKDGLIHSKLFVNAQTVEFLSPPSPEENPSDEKPD